MNYEELRNTYPVFYYHDYEIQESKDDIRITYDFEIEGLSHFNPEFIVHKPSYASEMVLLKDFRQAVFSLGMVELISYWKIACPGKTVVECAALDDFQIAWWKKLYFNGLGEFFYINGIDADPEEFMDLSGTGAEITGDEIDYEVKGNLIPVGGGKDSFVSLDLLKEYFDENHAFVINQVMSAVHSAQAAGYDGKNFVNPTRTLDPRMLDLNKQGFLNGHTPFSAMAAFAAYLTSIIYRKKYICLSNEASANESTVKDSKVNHQYSKTFEFEEDFNEYTSRYFNSGIHYFSLLRPLSELQIAGIFSTLTQYHSVFRSCNVGSKQERWCGHCAKCLFVCTMMAAYLEDEAVVDIFGTDMLNNPEMEDLFAQLTGMSDNKPFECVGTRDEVNVAVCMSIARHEAEGKELPLLYKNYRNSSYYNFFKGRSVDWDSYNEENLLPAEYAELLKRKLGEMKCC